MWRSTGAPAPTGHRARRGGSGGVHGRSDWRLHGHSDWRLHGHSDWRLHGRSYWPKPLEASAEPISMAISTRRLASRAPGESFGTSGRVEL
jgi:hypothetical protein